MASLKVFAASFGIFFLVLANQDLFAQIPVLPNAPEIIFKNAKIFNDRDTGRGWSQALSIRAGNILSIGTNKNIEAEKGPSTKVIDLKGRVVLPGFNDAHLHFVYGGLTLGRVDLSRLVSIAQIQEKLKSYAALHPEKDWVLGHGWDHTALPGQKFPTRSDIDAAVKERPVFLWHTDGHLAVVNSKGLEELGLTTSTPNPKGGEIARDEKGELSGILFEEAAVQVARKIDRPTPEEIKEAFRVAQDEAVKFGVTSVQGPIEYGEPVLKALEEAQKKQQLKLRFAFWGDLEKPSEFAELKKKYKHLSEDWVRFEALKGYLDGVLSARTAALIEPYFDQKSTKGEPNYTQEKLDELIFQANKLGFPVALHAVGDKAVSMAVSAVASARKQLFNSRLRNRVEHIEVATPILFDKFSALGLIASVQPSHLVYDHESQNYNEMRLGSQRIRSAFAWKSFSNANVHMAFGSDWPVMPINPMLGLMGAVFRQTYDGRPSGGWVPSQKISLEQALSSYTLGSAYATREEHVKGSLREGKYADLVVLEKDPFSARSAKELTAVPVYMTVVGGKIVYDGSTPRLEPLSTPAPSATPSSSP